MKKYKGCAVRWLTVCACLLVIWCSAEAKLVPVQQQAAASQPTGSTPATSQPDTSKNAAPATSPTAMPSDAPDDDRLPFMLGPDRDTHAESPSAIGLLARTFGALLLVIGLLIGGTWALRRVKGSPFAASRDDARLTVVKTINIGDRRSLTVVRFGERTLLLGSTQQSVTLLASDDDEDLSAWSSAIEPPFRSVADVLAASDDEPPARQVSFASELNRADEWGEALEGGRRESDDRSAKWR